MIAYLDTSALVKLYVSEQGSSAMRAQMARAEAVATSALAYAEARVAFARPLRSGRTNPRQHARRLRRFNLDWDHYVRIEAGSELIHEAGELAELYALRGFDALHLASGMWLKERSPTGLFFAAYDRRLHSAADLAGLRVYPGRLPAARV